jgi:hypothetical protein
MMQEQSDKKAIFLTSRRGAGIAVDSNMPTRLHSFACIAALAVTVVIAARGDDAPPAADETGLWQLWTTHTNTTADHAAVAQACATFRTKSPGDPLVVIAQELEAWRLLQAAKTNNAARLLEPLTAASSNALQKAAAEIARSWLTRVDRELVRAALKRVYLRDVEFPASLAAITTLKKPVTPTPSLTDRWNQPWSYQPTNFPTIKNTHRQRYILESSRLGADSDLALALASSYATRINLEPVRVLDSANTGETVEFATATRKKAVLIVGTEVNGVTFAFIGKTIIVLADRDYWRIALRPR